MAKKKTTPDLLPGLASRLELWPIERVIPYDRNPWKHPEEQIDRLAATIRKLGFNAPILVQGETIVAGHARLAAARRLGLIEVPVIPLDHLDEDLAKAARLADNRLGEFAELDDDLLAGELEELEGLELLDAAGWTDDELAELTAELDQIDGGPPEENEDPTAEAPQIFVPVETPTLEAGDLLEIGPHRLLVGDSLEEGVIARLVSGLVVDAIVTDPPYAIFGSSTGVGSEVADDKMVRPFFVQTLAMIGSVLKDFGQAFTFTDWRSWGSFHNAGRQSSLTLSNLLVWDKGDYGQGSNYMNCHELVGFWQRLPKAKSHRDKRPTGQRPTYRPNILRFARTRTSEAEGWTDETPRHSAAKPVRLLQELIANSTDEGDRVLDLFSGTGSTLVAAHLSGRIGLACEIEPKWAEVTISRLEHVSGETARLVGSGETLEQLRQERQES